MSINGRFVFVWRLNSRHSAESMLISDSHNVFVTIVTALSRVLVWQTLYI